MIDLARGYRDLAEALAHLGVRASYALTVQVWHHELGDASPSGPDVSFTASVIWGATCLQASNCPTLADAVADVERRLREHLAGRGEAAPPPVDLQVALPE